MTIRIENLNDALGAEVIGVDMNSRLSETELAVLESAFDDRGVLLFRGQCLTAQQLAGFSAQFGPLQPHVQRAYQHPEVPEVVVMTNQKADGSFDLVGASRGASENAHDGWHSDLSYDAIPAKATFLHSTNVPNSGGNTCFTNVTRAYELLPDEFKARLNGLTAEFRYGGHSKHKSTTIAATSLDAEAQKKAVAHHPVVNRHPKTGRPGIYANPIITTEIDKVSETESAEILDALFEAMNTPGLQWEHQWSVGDTLMWDNRGGTMHTGRLDYPRDQLRRFIRTTVRGGPTTPFVWRQ